MVSGLIFALVYWLWRRSHQLTLWLPARKAAAIAGVAAALGYALLAGFAVPAQRTVYMLAAVAIALWLGRSISMTAVLAWALLAVVVIDPWSVLSAGFWLSFGAIAVIMLVSAGGYRQNALVDRLGAGAMGYHAWPDPAIIGDVSAGITGFTFCKCDCNSIGEPGGGSLNAAGDIAAA